MSESNITDEAATDRNLMHIGITDSVPGIGRTKAAGEIKASELVLAAIHHLKEARGSTLKEIMDYVSREYNCDDNHLKRSVITALKRGVQYGIIKQDQGHYTLQPGSDDDHLILTAKARGQCVPRRPRRRPKRRKSACGCGGGGGGGRRRRKGSSRRRRSRRASRRARSGGGRRRRKSSRRRRGGSQACVGKRSRKSRSRRRARSRRVRRKRSKSRGRKRQCTKLPNFCGIPRPKKRKKKSSSRRGGGCARKARRPRRRKRASRRSSGGRCVGKRPRRCSREENEDS